MLLTKSKRRVSERSPSSSPHGFQAIRALRSSANSGTPFTPAQFTPVEFTPVQHTSYQMDTAAEAPENSTPENLEKEINPIDEEIQPRDQNQRPTASLSRYLEENSDAYDAYDLDLISFTKLSIHSKNKEKGPFQFFSSEPNFASISRHNPSPEPQNLELAQDSPSPRSPT